MLAHTPEYYPTIPNTRLHVAKLNLRGQLRVTVYYTVDLNESAITLLFMHRTAGS